MKNAVSPQNSGQSEGQFRCDVEPWTKLVDGAIGRSRRVVGAAHPRALGLLDLAEARNHVRRDANSPSEQAILLRLVSWA